MRPLLVSSLTYQVSGGGETPHSTENHQGTHVPEGPSGQALP